MEVESDELDLIKEVLVKYKPISQEGGNFISRVLPRIDNRFVFDISNTIGLQGIDADGRMLGIEYFFDIIGRFAADEIRSNRLFTYIRFPEGSPATDFSANGFLSAGDQVETYRMFSVPLALENPAINEVLEALGPYDRKAWRLFSTINNQYVEYAESNSPFTEFEVGKSFWIIFRNTPLNFGPGQGTTVQATDNEPFTLSLQSGWNQIGNPYNYTISWLDVLEHNRETYPNIEELLDPLGTFRGSAKVENAISVPRFSGGLIFVHQEEIELEIPIWKDDALQQRQSPAPLNLEQVANPIHFANWEVDLEVESGGLVHTPAGFGMNRNAKADRDTWDKMRPPRFIGTGIPILDITFSHPEYFYPHFSRDIVPFQTEYVWEFSVTAKGLGEWVTLRWDNAHFGKWAPKVNSLGFGGATLCRYGLSG